MIKINSLGGFGNVTSNLFVYETDKDILLVDSGVSFPPLDTEGGDLLVPSVEYLYSRKERIRGLILTHGHEDHIGGLPFVLTKLGGNFPIFGAKLTIALAKEKLTEARLHPQLETVESTRQLTLGGFKVEFIHVTHSIPDTFNLAMEVDGARIYHASDFKFDWTPVGQRLTEVGKIALIGNRGVDLLLTDCLRSENRGYTLSEASIESSLEEEVRDCSGRVLITTMSSNVSRWQQAARVCLREGRKIVLVGRSIEKIVRIARQLGYLKIPKESLIKLGQMKAFPPRALAFFVAGSQAQVNSALTKMAHGHFRELKIEAGDKVIISSDYIPGNEAAIYEMIDKLSYLGAEVSYSDIHDNLHVSGHAAQAELALMLNLVRPHFVVPIGGTFRQMKQYAQLAAKMGYTPEQVLLPESGRSLEITSGRVCLGGYVPIGSELVDTRTKEF
jgi:ribonuclease J